MLFFPQSCHTTDLVILCQRERLIYRVARITSCSISLFLANHNQSLHNPAFYLVQGCQCKMDVSRWEGVGADCSTCQICTSHLKRNCFLECLHQEQTATSTKMFLILLLVTALVYVLSYLPRLICMCLYLICVYQRYY